MTNTISNLDIAIKSNKEAIEGFAKFLGSATKTDLDEAIHAVREASKDLRNPAEDRRLAKNVLAVIAKERKQFL